MAKKQKTTNKEIENPNIAGSKGVDALAIDKVTGLFESYKKMRQFEQGGRTIIITDKWNERYRLYNCIRNERDHNYKTGIAKVFAPIARKQINVIDSEISNALFSREDYFKVKPTEETEERSLKDSHIAYKVIKKHSDQEDYVSNFDISAKQCAIYGTTCGEVTWHEEKYTVKRKRINTKPLLDEKSGEPMFMAKGDKQVPLLQKEIVVVDEKVHIQRPTIKARDIFRLYFNHLSNNPIDEDIVYRDSISAQRLLEMADLGAYSKRAVNRLVKMSPGKNSRDVDDGNENGKSFYDEVSQSNASDKINAKYEVLRFQGLFTTSDPETGLKKQEQYWIDVGERSVVLRVIKNPLWSKEKTFRICEYDTMYGESYVDGVIDDGTASIQYEVNDKENQSLDAVSFNLNAPWLKSRRSKIKSSEINVARKRANYVIETNDMEGLKKTSEKVDVGHISNEITRLINYSDSATGATNVLSGQPTGTSADRSGKSLGILAQGGKSQFSKFIRKYERKFMSPLLSLAWDMNYQFSDERITITEEIVGADEKKENVISQMSVAEVVSDLFISVTAGSEYLKNKEMVNSILQFISITNVREEWAMSLDSTPMLTEIARSMPYDMSAYVNPDSAMAKLLGQNREIQQLLQQYQGALKSQNDEATRLQNELKQTDRSNMANPSPVDKIQSATSK